MTHTMIKICGLMNRQTLDAIQGLPIDQLGFMFARSRRQVSPELAGELIRHLHDAAEEHRPLTVGVFVNPAMEELVRVLAQAPLDVIQLHGSEDAAFCKAVKEKFGVLLYKVVSVAKGMQTVIDPLQDLETELAQLRGAVDAILLDTQGGGTGKTFDWSVIPPYLEWAKTAGISLIVAGGLEPGNVAGLIRTYRPHGVDVSSGVETDGVKDPEKIKDFVERVKSA